MIGAKHDWANLNTLRSYPLEYNKSLIADTGFVFSDQILSDLTVIAQSSNYDPRLSSIHFSSNLISLCFFDMVSNEDSFIAQAPLSSNYYYSSIISVGSVNVSGGLIFGSFNEILKYTSTGIHKFNKTDSKIVDHCIFIAGEPPVLTMSGGGDPLTNEVELVAAGKLKFNVSTSNDGYGNEKHNIIVSLADPESFIEECIIPQNICECLLPPIEKINTVYPDENGNIEIVTEDLNFSPLQIENSNNNIIISVIGSNQDVCDLGTPSADGLLPSEQ